MRLLYIIHSFFCILTQRVCAIDCFNQLFPIFFGAADGATEIMTMDFDDDTNLAFGGYTEASSMSGFMISARNPFVAVIDAQSEYLWAKYFDPYYVAAKALSYDSSNTKIVVVFTHGVRATADEALSFAVINAATGLI